MYKLCGLRICVLARDGGHTSLGRWVNGQRVAYNAKLQGRKLSSHFINQSRIDALNELGMIWKHVEHVPWEHRLEQLKEFKAATGHTVVPQHFAENKQLGKWVTRKRYAEPVLRIHSDGSLGR